MPLPPSGLRLCLLQPDAPVPGEAHAALVTMLHRIAVQEGHSVIQAEASETGVRIRAADGEADTTSPQPLPRRLVGPDAAHAAYHVLEWLRLERFDIVCAPACAGLLFYAVSARHQGFALRDTAFCTLADGLTLLSRHLSQEMPRGMDDLVRDEMERRVLALSDLAWPLRPEIASWASGNGWTIPGLRPVPASGDTEAVARAIWADLAAVKPGLAAASPASGEAPLVSVCIPHFNRPALLRQAIDSIRQQTYPRIEIVVVDDASTAPEAQAALPELEADLARQGGRLVRHDTNRYPGAARNTAARHAGGDFLLFLDDDDYAKPDQVATLIQVARATGADIVNSLCDRLNGDQPPEPGQQAEERWLALGNAPTIGMFENLFGTVSALFRRSSFQQLGGFGELRGVGCEDWELFARGSLAGMNLQTVPQALYWYRLTPGSMAQTGSVYAGADRALRAWFGYVPRSVWPALRFAHGAEPRLRRLEGDVRHREAVLRHQEALIAHLTRDHAEQVSALSRELSEARAVCRIMLGGDGATPQAVVDAMLQSPSWRIAGLFQAPFRRLTGRKQSAPPRVANWEQAAAVIATLRESSSWELTGVLRALTRWTRRR